MNEDERSQALVFGEVAETYHQARPRYPEQLVGDVLAFAPTPAAGSALEVGAGTGIATALFAKAGLTITAIEPNEQMAAVAKRELPDRVRIVVARFEEWEADQPFDLVYAAQSWHWIDPAAGFARTHQLLRPTGALALIWNLEDQHQPDRPSLLDQVYEDFSEDFRSKAPPARTRSAADLSADLVATPLFTAPQRLTYPWQKTYTTEEFLSLQMTHSPKRMLPPERREELFGRIAAAVDSHGGATTIRYTTNVFLSRPVGPA